MFEAPEDQQKAILPLNKDTEVLFYNLRMIIDNRVSTEKRTWRITKLNRISPNGNVMLTFAQDQFDPHKDYIEYNDDGDIIGMWCNWFDSGNIIPKIPEEPDTNVYCKVSYMGKSDIKINGSYKKFRVDFYREGVDIDYKDGEWSFKLKNPENNEEQDASSLVSVKNIENSINEINVKYKGDLTYYHWILVVTFTMIKDGKEVLSDSAEVNITRL